MLQQRVGFGLHIATEFEIAGSLAAASPHAQADLRVIRGDASLPQTPGSENIILEPYTLQGKSLLFTAPSARYRCDAAASLITIEPTAEADSEMVSALLIATALPAMLWMRGAIMLHAAAAVLPGHSLAVGFAGASGSGKTHTLRRLLDEDAAVLAEDSLRIYPGARQPSAAGLPGCFFERVPGMPSSHRKHIPVPYDRQLIEAGLGALIILGTGEDSTPRRLRGPEVVAALLGSLHRPLVPRLLGQLPTLLPRLAALAQWLPVYRWSPPLQGKLLPALHPLQRDQT